MLIAYSDCKGLKAKRTISDMILKDRAYEIARNCKHDEYQRALESTVNKLFYKKAESWVSVTELSEEWHKSVMKKFTRRNVYARFKRNIWAADLNETRSLSSKNQMWNIAVFTQYAWVKHLQIVNQSNHKPDKLWADETK